MSAGAITGNANPAAPQVDSSSILGHLQALERLLGEVETHRQGIETASGKVESDAYRYVAALYLRALNRKTDALQEAILGRDGLGDAVDSLTELATRAVRFVVLTELRKLDVIFMRPEGPVPGPALREAFISWGTLRVFVDARLTSQLRALNHDRERLREDRPRYRDLIRSVDADLASVAARLAPILDEGIQRTDWPELAGLCGRMRDALAVRVAVQPDEPLAMLDRVEDVDAVTAAPAATSTGKP